MKIIFYFKETVSQTIWKILFVIFLFSGNSYSNSITTLTTVSSSYCAGDPISISYITSGPFVNIPTKNVFTAQLSDAQGSFSFPLNIGTLTSLNAGIISATLPAAIPAGKGYRIRVVASNPATIGTDNGSDLTINAAPGDPSVFGKGFWNAYCYNGDLVLNLVPPVYYGYYTENNLSFNSGTRYPYSGVGVPSSANAITGKAYSGCNPVNSKHTMSYKRVGFACGLYQLDVLGHDDDAYLLINGIQVWTHMGCCDVHTNVWTGTLDSTSTVEFKWVNRSSGSIGNLKFTAVNPIAQVATSVSCNQFTANWNPISNISNYFLDVATDAAFSNILPAYSNLNAGTATSFSITGLIQGTNYYYRVRGNNAICGTTSNSNIIHVNAFVPSATLSTWTGNISTDWFTSDNWCGNVPDSTTDVVIPAGTVNIPNINYASSPSWGWNYAEGAYAHHLNINKNAMLIISGDRALNVYGNWINDGIFVPNVANVSMYGNVSTIGGSGNNNFADLKLNTRTAGSITLNTPIHISGKLTLNQGLLNTSTTNILNMDAGSVASIGNNSSYVNGPLNYVVASSGITSINLPVGDDGNWRPAVLKVNHLDNSPVTYTGKLYTASAKALGYSLPPTISYVSSVHYWQLDRQSIANLVSANVQLYYGANDLVTDYNNLMVANAPLASWINLYGTATANTKGSITSGTFLKFGKFTLASQSIALPVELSNFNANQNGKEIELSWTTSTEKNNNYFTLERSTDGSYFVTISTVKGAGNSTTPIQYNSVDPDPYTGLSYYRIKQTDFNGASSYSSTICINYNTADGLKVCTNPVETGDAIYISMGLQSSDKEVLVVLRDIQGREFYSKVILEMENHQMVAINPQPQLAAGIYLIVATSDNKIYSQKIMVK